MADYNLWLLTLFALGMPNFRQKNTQTYKGLGIFSIKAWQ